MHIQFMHTHKFMQHLKRYDEAQKLFEKGVELAPGVCWCVCMYLGVDTG